MSAEGSDYAAYRIKELGLGTPMGLLGPMIIGVMCAWLFFVIENPVIMVAPGGPVDIETCNDYFDCYACHDTVTPSDPGYYYDIPGWPGQALNDPTNPKAGYAIEEGSIMGQVNDYNPYMWVLGCVNSPDPPIACPCDSARASQSCQTNHPLPTPPAATVSVSSLRSITKHVRGGFNT